MLGLFIVPGLAGTITSVATIRTMRDMSARSSRQFWITKKSIEQR
jgi:hypothetical protein